jgi:hypothetical protein
LIAAQKCVAHELSDECARVSLSSTPERMTTTTTMTRESRFLILLAQSASSLMSSRNNAYANMQADWRTDALQPREMSYSALQT